MSTILLFLSYLVMGLSGLMVFPFITALVRGPMDDAASYGIALLIAGGLSALLILALRGLTGRFGRVEGLLLLVLAWPVLAVISGIPIALADNRTMAHAMFEGLSGLTTTGFTVFDIDTQPSAATKIWRALLQWYGGLLTLLSLVLVLAPLEAGGLSRRGLSLITRNPVGQSSPIAGQVRTIATAYLATSFACFAWLIASGVIPFDAFCLALAAVSTGGMTPNADPIDVYVSPAGQIGLILFMVVGATSILWQGALIRFDGHQLRNHRESYFVILFTLIIGLMIGYLFQRAAGGGSDSLMLALREGLFAGASIISTTGFQIREESFSVLPVVLIVIVAFIGGGAMSTAGGLKLFRVGILMVQATRELRRSIFPHGVGSQRIGIWRMTDTGIEGVYAAAAVAVLVAALTLSLLTTAGLSFDAAIMAAVAATSNMGPVYGSGLDPAEIWPPVNTLPPLGLLALSFAMIAGRVEFLALFAVLNVAYWSNR